MTPAQPAIQRPPLLRPEAIRPYFPALYPKRSGERAPIFLDGPGGTQVPEPVLLAMADYVWEGTANTGGPFRTSRRTDRAISAARSAAADLVGTTDPDEIVFGPNMTSLTFRVAGAIGRALQPGDEVIVTHLDHDANVAPWRTLSERGIRIVEWAFRPEDCTLDLDALDRLIGPRTRLVAVGLASNAVGTINQVRAIAERARAAGAWSYVDAVHFAPHGLIDVVELGCDFLVCSAYKFFGPYLGILWGRRELLESLPVHKVRPAHDSAPERWETGTKDHIGLAGLTAAVDYLADLADLATEPSGPDEGEQRPGFFEPPRYAAESLVRPPPQSKRPDSLAARQIAGGAGSEESRRKRLVRSFEALRRYERELSRRMLEGLGQIDGLRIYGITDVARLDERVPTVSFTVDGIDADSVAARLAEHGINCWSGNFYAISVVERLDIEARGGLVRVGAVHYNTHAEIDVLIAAVREVVSTGKPSAPS